jgi:hypothetical protein
VLERTWTTWLLLLLFIVVVCCCCLLLLFVVLGCLSGIPEGADNVGGAAAAAWDGCCGHQGRQRPQQLAEEGP